MFNQYYLNNMSFLYSKQNKNVIFKLQFIFSQSCSLLLQL